MTSVSIHRSPDGIYRRCNAKTRECDYEHLQVEGATEEILRFFNALRHAEQPKPAAKSTYTPPKPPTGGIGAYTSRYSGTGGTSIPVTPSNGTSYVPPIFGDDEGDDDEDYASWLARDPWGKKQNWPPLEEQAPAPVDALTASTRAQVKQSILRLMAQEFSADIKAADTVQIAENLMAMATNESIPAAQRSVNLRGMLVDAWGAEEENINAVRDKIMQRAGYIASEIRPGTLRFLRIEDLIQAKMPASAVHVGDVIKIPDSRVTYMVSSVVYNENDKMSLNLRALYLSNPMVDSEQHARVTLDQDAEITLLEQSMVSTR